MERDKEELFDKEPATRSRKKRTGCEASCIGRTFRSEKEKLQVQKKGADEHLDRINKELHLLEDGLNKVDMFRKDETFCPPSVTEIGEKPTRKNCDVIVEELKSLIVSTIRKTEEFKESGDAVQWKLLVKKTRFISVRNWLENRITMISLQSVRVCG